MRALGNWNLQQQRQRRRARHALTYITILFRRSAQNRLRSNLGRGEAGGKDRHVRFYGTESQVYGSHVASIRLMVKSSLIRTKNKEQSPWRWCWGVVRDCGVSEDGGYLSICARSQAMYNRLTLFFRRRAGGAHKKCRPHGFEHRV